MNEIDPETLYGTWKLIGSREVDADGRLRADPWGPNPVGCLVLERSGRMAAVLSDGRSDLPAGATRAYSSYCGQFVVEGDVLTTTIDAASDPSRLGSLQPRRLAMRDGRLVLMPPPRRGGETREILWERLG